MSEQEEGSSPRRLAQERPGQLLEQHTHSFVLRIWREEALVTNGEGVWRGHITHVMSGQHRYFQQISDVISFITPYLATLEQVTDKRLSWANRLHHWLCRRLHCGDGHRPNG